MSLDIDRRLFPCRGVCSSATVGSAYCVGCGRSKQQVDDWQTVDENGKPLISDEEKIKIMEAIHKRTLISNGKFPS